MYNALIAISIILFISNLILLYFLKKKKKPQEKIELTHDANQLLSELLKGGAVVTVQVASPADVFMWSPKEVK